MFLPYATYHGTYKTNPGDVAGYRGPKGIVGVGIILLVSLTSAIGVILRK